ncbi:MAG TPA: vitamin K epoxide reductase family protein [Pyrinomonadaceae bacterium]|jgi:uncharacterized membrane protein|nr:vitamin K epoxide reductase family protein [Pyrinomonadaceae bacterium]
MKRTWLYAAAALLALLGLADAIYLTVEHVTGQSVRCTIVAGCSEVLSSSYAVVAGIPLAMVGAAAYFSVFDLALLAAFGYRVAATLLTPLVIAMFLVSLWLIYLQAFVIHAFCQFCLFSAAITFALFVCVLVARRVKSV